jgi:hypothetical protein
MRSPRAAVVAVAVLATAAVAAVAAASSRDPSAAARSLDFQRAVGGLGVGALDLSACDAAFDPRVGFPCPDATGALPGGRRFCLHLGGPGDPRR